MNISKFFLIKKVLGIYILSHAYQSSTEIADVEILFIISESAFEKR